MSFEAANNTRGTLNTLLLKLPNIETPAPIVSNTKPIGPNIFEATSPNGFSVNEGSESPRTPWDTVWTRMYKHKMDKTLRSIALGMVLFGFFTSPLIDRAEPAPVNAKYKRSEVSPISENEGMLSQYRLLMLTSLKPIRTMSRRGVSLIIVRVFTNATPFFTPIILM